MPENQSKTRVFILLSIAFILAIFGIYFYMTSSTTAAMFRPTPQFVDNSPPTTLSGTSVLQNLPRLGFHIDQIESSAGDDNIEDLYISLDYVPGEEQPERFKMAVRRGVNDGENQSEQQEETEVFEFHRTPSGDYAVILPSDETAHTAYIMTAVPFAALACLPGNNISEGDQWQASIFVTNSSSGEEIFDYQSTMQFDGWISHQDQLLGRVKEQFKATTANSSTKDSGTATYYFSPTGQLLGGQREGLGLTLIVTNSSGTSDTDSDIVNFHTHQK